MKTTNHKGRVYISGPISGLEKLEYVYNFAEAEAWLHGQGYHRTVNPTRVWACRWAWLYRIVGYRLTLLYDLWLLSRCQYIYQLPGSNKSRGARLESRYATEFGIKYIKH